MSRNARDYLGGYLQKEDVPEPIVVTICRDDERLFEGDDRPSLILYFDELVKGLVCNQTNLNALIEMLGTDKIDQWKGKKIVIFTDETITFGGRRVGGLRVRKPTVEELKLVETAF